MQNEKPETYIPSEYELKTYDTPFSPYSSAPSTPDTNSEFWKMTIRAVEHFDSDGSPYIEHESANEFSWHEDRSEIEKEYPGFDILDDGNFVFTL
jgi:hypothetical protein